MEPKDKIFELRNEIKRLNEIYKDVWEKKIRVEKEVFSKDTAIAAIIKDRREMEKHYLDQIKKLGIESKKQINLAFTNEAIITDLENNSEETLLDNESLLETIKHQDSIIKAYEDRYTSDHLWNILINPEESTWTIRYGEEEITGTIIKDDETSGSLHWKKLPSKLPQKTIRRLRREISKIEEGFGMETINFDFLS